MLVFVNTRLVSANPISINALSQLPSGTTAPDFNLTDVLTSETFSLSDFAGKTVILDLFTTYCGACVQAIPRIRDIFQCYSPQDLIIVSIDLDPSQSEEQLREFILEHDMEWLVALDNNSAIDSNYGSEYVPTMYIIDKNQTVAYSEIGFSFEEVVSTLDELELEPIEPLPSYTSSGDILDLFIGIILFGMGIVVIFTISVVFYVRHQQKKKAELYRVSQLAYKQQQRTQMSSAHEGSHSDICPKCGQLRELNAKFCVYCGSDFRIG